MRDAEGPEVAGRRHGRRHESARGGPGAVWVAALAALVVASCGELASEVVPDPTQEAGRPVGQETPGDGPGWISLFDGVVLDGWKASEHPDTFSVRDGVIVAHGPRAHLFYVGPVEEHDFKDFEFKADVMTRRGSNSGLYFHTRYQETGWPGKGYEAQVNSTHRDRRKTGSLYAVADIAESPAEDDVWFTYHIIVRGKRIILKVDGETTVDYTEPADAAGRKGSAGRILSSGTFAIQGHDPGSEVHFRNIMVKPLPE